MLRGEDGCRLQLVDRSLEPIGEHDNVLDDGQHRAGDFDNDGNVDLAVGSSNNDGGPSSFSIIYGHGDGTFEVPLAVGTSYGPSGVAAADFNGDGWLDLAATEDWGAVGNGHFYAATILLNDGCGP